MQENLVWHLVSRPWRKLYRLVHTLKTLQWTRPAWCAFLREFCAILLSQKSWLTSSPFPLEYLFQWSTLLDRYEDRFLDGKQRLFRNIHEARGTGRRNGACLLKNFLLGASNAWIDCRKNQQKRSTIEEAVVVNRRSHTPPRMIKETTYYRSEGAEYHSILCYARLG